MALRSRDRGERETQRTLDEFEEVAGLRNEDGSRGAYAVEHLATFTVTRETGIVYPADGMRRLLQLEKTNGIWSQKMQLCVDGQWVLVMDFETGSIMERFPAAWVHSPTAFTSPEPGELYNNVVAFVVGPPSSSSPAPGADEPRKELHIFQCHDVAAQALVEELNSLKGGSGSGEGGRDFIIEREREREKESEIDRPHRQMAALRERDDASSTGSDRLYEQDIAILNRCFDDIEKFIARLQHAAAASRELERRRRGRNSNSNGKKAGDGMLALRGRPPPERDFVDVLQKFKLSFNLLARLRAHIHDPNAPELVHFLFTPLALIVDAAGDATPGLPSRVVQPLLTRDALNLLANCVTSKETELWHSLGDAWLIPREQWKTTVPPYQPVFMDGWTPDYQVDDQPLRRPSPRRSDPRSRDETGPGVYDRDEPDLYGEQYGPYRNARPPARGDSGSVASSPERETPYRPDRDEEESAVGVEPEVEDDAEAEAAWARSVTSRGGRLVRVTYPRTANNDKELTVRRGELLELLDDSRKWWRARNRRGRVAHVPHTIVAPAAPPATPHRAEDDGNRDWMRRERLGKKVEGTSTPSPPTPPPLPPPPTPLDPIIMIRNNYSDTMRSSASTISGGGDMQEELKAVLTLYQQRKNKLDIKKTPDIFIDQMIKCKLSLEDNLQYLRYEKQSSPSEVEAWLQAKGFSEDIQRNLRISGQDLFALSRMQLERILGHEDGKRLYSQVLVQRNVSGYKTRSSSELQSILRKVREKVEVS